MLDLLEELRFDRVGAFTYSIEEGTRAAELPDQIPEGLRRSRLEELMEVQRDISLDLNLEQVGRRCLLLVDERLDGPDGDPEHVAVGRTEGQAIDVDGVTHILRDEAAEPPLPGSMIEVEIVDALDYDLIAEVRE
jgi:ribosomal protein S12 methylthiotransferase